MKFSNPISTAFALAGAMTLTGCLADSPSTPKSPGATPDKSSTTTGQLYDQDNVDEVINHIGNGVILATYTDLNTRVNALVTACDQLRTQRTTQALALAQAAWKAARVPWESTESFLIGPVDALGIDPKMDTWPLAVHDLQNVLASNPNISVDIVRGLDTNLQGFHTAEFLLFGDGVLTNHKDISAFTTSEFAYLSAVTRVMAEHTGELLQAWTVHGDPEDASSVPFIQVFTLKAGNQPTGFVNRIQVLQTIVEEGMMGISDEVGNGKLATPLGETVASADPSLVESQFSWNSLTDFHNNLESIAHLYTGLYGVTAGPGIQALVQKVDPKLDLDILSELAKAEQAVADIGGPAGANGIPFTQAIQDAGGRERTQNAIEEVNRLHDLLRDRLVPLVK